MIVVIKQVWDHCCRGSLSQRTFEGAVAWEAPSVLPSGAAGLWPGQFLSNPGMHRTFPGVLKEVHLPQALLLWGWSGTRWVL